ncbi:MAG: hypothetical protein ACJ705_04590 [Nitrososphaeraceae archaeon]|jgi:hypothetical protein
MTMHFSISKGIRAVYKFSSLESIANTCVEIDKAISEISTHNLCGVTNYSIV